MEGPNLDLIEFFLVIFFLNLNQHAKNENGQVENSQKKNMFEKDNKKDTFDEGCEDKPDEDSSFKFQQKSNMIPTTLEVIQECRLRVDANADTDLITEEGTKAVIPSFGAGQKKDSEGTNTPTDGNETVPEDIQNFYSKIDAEDDEEEEAEVGSKKFASFEVNQEKLETLQQLSPYSVPTFHTSVKIIIFTSLLAILTNNFSPKAILHDTANYMSASSFTVIGYPTTKQEIFLADTNMVNKHGSDEKPNRWREMSYEYSSLSKHQPKLAKVHWRPTLPHCLGNTMWKDLPKITEILFKIQEQDTQGSSDQSAAVRLGTDSHCCLHIEHPTEYRFSPFPPGGGMIK